VVEFADISEISEATNFSEFEGFDFYHSLAWLSLLKQTFGWSVGYLLVKGEDGNIQALLPAVEKKAVFVRTRRFVSLPLVSESNIAYAKRAEGDELRVWNELGEFARTWGSLTLHFAASKNHSDCATFGRREVGVVTELNLRNFASADELRRSFEQKSIRYMINRAEKGGVTVEQSDSLDAYKKFYALMVETRHRQGAPVYPWAFFRNMQKAFAGTGKVRLWLAMHQGKALSAVVLFHLRNSTHYAYAASVSDRDLKRLGASELLLARAIEESRDRGVGEFSFGYSPSHLPMLKAYKEKWGGVSRPLFYSSFPSEARLNRESRAVRMASAVLRIAPEAVFKCIGPMIFRRVI
jgi:hypothetical protein